MTADYDVLSMIRVLLDSSSSDRDRWDTAREVDRAVGPEGYEWGDYAGFVSAHRFAVDTVENRRVFYDVTKGVRVDGESGPVRRFWTKQVDHQPTSIGSAYEPKLN